MGYYKLPDKTKEALTHDGWLKTGDVGMMMPGSMAMRIVDRKKNIFKLQQGEYVASEKVEAVYTKSPLIAEAFLYGDSTQNYPVAVFSVKEEPIKALASSLGITGDLDEICKRKEMRL